jgi:hypothetical protein
MTTIKIVDITKRTNCIDPQLAEPIFNEILSHIQNDQHVNLSFAGVDLIITAFLQVAIGKLFDPSLKVASKIDTFLTIIDADEDQMDKVEQVKAYAKMYYDDPEQLKEIAEEK